MKGIILKLIEMKKRKYQKVIQNEYEKIIELKQLHI